jgi:hypothetical protein
MMASTLYRFHFPSSSCYTGGIKQAHYLYGRPAGIARHAFMLYNGETYIRKRLAHAPHDRAYLDIYTGASNLDPAGSREAATLG